MDVEPSRKRAYTRINKKYGAKQLSQYFVLFVALTCLTDTAIKFCLKTFLQTLSNPSAYITFYSEKRCLPTKFRNRIGGAGMEIKRDDYLNKLIRRQGNDMIKTGCIRNCATRTGCFIVPSR